MIGQTWAVELKQFTVTINTLSGINNFVICTLKVTYSMISFVSHAREPVYSIRKKRHKDTETADTNRMSTTKQRDLPADTCTYSTSQQPKDKQRLI